MRLFRLIPALLCLVIPFLIFAQDATQPAPDSLPPADTAAEVDSLAPDSVSSAGVIYDDEGEQIYPMSTERYERLVSYSRFNNIWRFVSFFVGLAVLAVILFSGLSARFRDWSKKIRPGFFALWAFVILFLVAQYVLELPFSIYRGYVVESNYGFMNQTFLQWWGEDLLSLLIGLVFLVVPVWFLYWLINRLKHWWLWFSLGMIPFMILIVVVVPIWISPLFNQFGPLQDEELKEEILTLAESAGIEGADVFEVDASKQSDKINAYVTGLFGTKRIVLYDTMIRGFTTGEIKFVMAHEMGHYVMNHLWQGLGLSVIFIMFLLWLTNRTVPLVIRKFRGRFGFDRMGDYASLPLLLAFLTIASFIFQPVTNTFSRYLERQADTYGLEMSGVDAETAATTFDKLSVFNLSDPSPHPIIEFWFYSHPSLEKRIEFVRNWLPR